MAWMLPLLEGASKRARVDSLMDEGGMSETEAMDEVYGPQLPVTNGDLLFVTLTVGVLVLAALITLFIVLT